MKDAYLIILTKDKITKDLSMYDHLIISDDASLIDENHIKTKEDIYEFTYLIIKSDINVDYSNVSILKEDNIPVTNYFKETSIENIYYTNTSIEDVLESLEEE